MPVKRDMDLTAGEKLLRLFLRLMADRNRHFQADLAVWLNCSKQTIIRLMGVIESVVGTRLKMGMEDRRRWYLFCPDSRMPLGLDCEELRFLHICRDMASAYLPAQVQRRVDDSLFRLAMQLADTPSSAKGQRIYCSRPERRGASAGFATRPPDAARERSIVLSSAICSA